MANWKFWEIAKENAQKNKSRLKKRQTPLKFQQKIVLIGAGESVNRADLKKLVKEDIDICCCDIAYKHLDIPIKYVFTVDPNYTAETDAHGGFFKGVCPKLSRLVSYTGAAWQRVKDWKSDIFFYELENDDGIRLLKKGLPKVKSGTNVFNIAVMLIMKFRPDAKILMIGNELSYDKSQYFFKDYEGAPPVKVNGRKTTVGYAKAARWLNRAIKEKLIRSVYQTEPGLITGIPIMSVERFSKC